jgi:hypothetical protein
METDMPNRKTRQFFLITLSTTLLAVLPAKAESLKAGCYPKQEVVTFLQNNHQSQVDQFYAVTYQGRKKTTLTAEHNGTGYVKGGMAYLVETDDKEACITAKMRVVHMGPDALKGKDFFAPSDKDIFSEGCKKATKDNPAGTCPHYNQAIKGALDGGDKIIIQGIGIYNDNGTEREGSILETVTVDPAENGTGELLFSEIPSGATYSVGLFNRSATLSAKK